MQSECYEVSVHGSSSGLRLVPSSRVHNSQYWPSAAVKRQIAEMWNHRKPRVIGTVSELVAKEILNGSQITADGFVWTLICNELRDVTDISGRWNPAKGIYCDDLIAIAECGGKKLLFLTEVKGTTLKEGLSHSMEAKIFYQLARTCVTLRQKLPLGPRYPIRGVITVVITHAWKKITINVLNESAARGYFPDHWLYRSESS